MDPAATIHELGNWLFIAWMFAAFGWAAFLLMLLSYGTACNERDRQTWLMQAAWREIEEMRERRENEGEEWKYGS
jgi:hypothetical protein